MTSLESLEFKCPNCQTKIKKEYYNTPFCINNKTGCKGNFLNNTPQLIFNRLRFHEIKNLIGIVTTFGIGIYAFRNQFEFYGKTTMANLILQRANNTPPPPLDTVTILVFIAIVLITGILAIDKFYFGKKHSQGSSYINISKNIEAKN